MWGELGGGELGGGELGGGELAMERNRQLPWRTDTLAKQPVTQSLNQCLHDLRLRIVFSQATS